MKRTVQQPVTDRPVKSEQFDDWVKKEVNPTLKALYVFANMRYAAAFPLTTAATGTYTAIWTDEIPDNSSWFVEAMVVGRATAGGAARAGYRFQGLFYREGGGAVQEGATAVIVPPIESVVAFDARFAVSGNDVLVQVLDDGARTVAWQAIIAVQEVTR